MYEEDRIESIIEAGTKRTKRIMRLMREGCHKLGRKLEKTRRPDDLSDILYVRRICE